MENNIINDYNTFGLDTNDPIKKQLLKLLERVRNTEVLIREILADDLGSDALQNDSRSSVAAREFHAEESASKPEEDDSYKTSPLSLFIHDQEQLKSFIHRLGMCKTSKEWAVHAVYPLYENGDITAEVAKNKHFIELTIPYCKKMAVKNYNTLVKQLKTHCYFPR